MREVEIIIKAKSCYRKSIKGFSIFPNIGKQVDFKNTRAVSLGHFSILYTIQNDIVIITAFLDNRDDPEKLLKMLKK